jgi:hypothetical protein
VRADDAGLFDRPHGVDLVEPLTSRHQYIPRGYKRVLQFRSGPRLARVCRPFVKGRLNSASLR